MLLWNGCLTWLINRTHGHHCNAPCCRSAFVWLCAAVLVWNRCPLIFPLVLHLQYHIFCVLILTSYLVLSRTGPSSQHTNKLADAARQLHQTSEISSPHGTLELQDGIAHRHTRTIARGRNRTRRLPGCRDFPKLPVPESAQARSE